MELLSGVEVVDLTGEPGALAGALLTALGARSVAPAAPAGTAPRVLLSDWTTPARDLPAPGTAIRAHLSPFGTVGPRATWRGSDLTILAASGNLNATGDPDRPPLRSSRPASHAHAGIELALAALLALHAGVAQTADVSAQEAMLAANMTAPARAPLTGERGQRRGARIGRTRETWRCADGWVVFGMRGGRARVRNWHILRDCLQADGHDASALERDWERFSHHTEDGDVLAAIEAALAAWFLTKTTAELDALAAGSNLMLAPVADAEAILANPQLQARGFWARRDGVRRPAWPLRTVEGTTGPAVSWGGAQPLAGLRVVELGGGAAGPLVGRCLAEHGATCIKIESPTRPDFLRAYARAAGDPPNEGSAFFAGINAGKRSVALDLKDPEDHARARDLIAGADVLIESFAPGAMTRLGLDWEALADVPGLVMLSSSLYGQTGPRRDYPGFGSQGAALSGWTYLTSWPDRAPVGPHGTITDSLAPRIGAAAVVAALWRRRHVGMGTYLDLSQVESAIWCLGDWLADAQSAHPRAAVHPIGNRHPDAVPHGVFPTRGDDRHVAIACWDDADWQAAARVLGIDDRWPGAAARSSEVDAIEHAVAAATADRDATELAATLQQAGVDACPVADFLDLVDDETLAAREHFVTLTHPIIGDHLYERSGVRLPATPGHLPGPGPTLGQHTAEILPAPTVTTSRKGVRHVG